MKSSPVYCNIYNPRRRSDCSFGSDGFSQAIKVGTSANNSHSLAEISVQHDGDMFTLWIDGVLIKRGTLTGKDFDMTLDKIAKL